MSKTTEQTFKVNVTYDLTVTMQNLKDLFCTIGQGSGYWAYGVTVGDIKEDKDGYYLPNQDYEHEGCCAWLKDINLDTVIKVEDCEEDKHQFKVRDMLTAIEKIISGKTNLNSDDCWSVHRSFMTDDLSLIDASIADSILQITTYNTLENG